MLPAICIADKCQEVDWSGPVDGDGNRGDGGITSAGIGLGSIPCSGGAISGSFFLLANTTTVWEELEDDIQRSKLAWFTIKYTIVISNCGRILYDTIEIEANPVMWDAGPNKGGPFTVPILDNSTWF